MKVLFKPKRNNLLAPPTGDIKRVTILQITLYNGEYCQLKPEMANIRELIACCALLVVLVLAQPPSFPPVSTVLLFLNDDSNLQKFHQKT